MSTDTTTPAAVHGEITRDRLARAFERWEQGWRATPSAFRSEAECLALGVSEVSAERADYFFALLATAD